ncbi:amylo-alpha-1,6-glucosidase [Acidisphaera sp. L21]|uniref:amylo-alpha-1,6-glucosidase n=1 Tax=Acidisphaera sp. L21 TaxID=1641851 RepID=UPI00131E78B6|nr:amylo-alpha-1,6-glucosidase [Acidisphaera sp. L21]
MDTLPTNEAAPGATPDPNSVSAATSLQERRFHVLKNDDNFAVLDSIGDMLATPGSTDGLYYRDTRHLSQISLMVGGARPLLLSSSLSRDNLMLTANLTNARIYDVHGIEIDQGLIYIRRSVFLVGGACFCRLALFNHGMQPYDIMVHVGFESDFADLFEVRGMHRLQRGTQQARVVSPDSVRVDYNGLDHAPRQTLLRFDPMPVDLGPDCAAFRVQLLPGKHATTVFIQVECEPHRVDERRPGLAFGSYLLQARRAARASSARTASIESTNTEFDEAIARAASDLRMLTTSKPTGPYPYAGIPWFSTAFGRDALITALLVLWQDPSLARGVLGYLAQEQATEFDPSSDAEPGKILHEVRAGEMAEMREVPFRRYYGSVDATPLFVMLAGAYLERTGDVEALRAIWPNIEAALGWMDHRGDGDGFVSYHRMTEDGLANQGWKDSYDSISHADGTLATGPITLCEVQGYVYAARRAAADIARQLGHDERATALDAAADRLQIAFEAKFWSDRLKTYVLALDGAGAQCDVRASNAGHALLTGIASPERAALVAAGLMSAECFSGWGIRTLAVGEVRYNPMSYHNGSVWPHDNALIALGFARYGLIAEAARLFGGLYSAGGTFEMRRLPELFCGFTRRLGQLPTPYPVACSPQAWAAATLPALVQACLGLSFQPGTGTVRLDRPMLPSFLDQITLRNLSLGTAMLSLTVRRSGEQVSVETLHRHGDVQVTLTS